MDFPNQIRERLAQTLPGREAQYKMASLRRLTELGAHQKPENPKIACVLNLLHFHEGHWRTVLIERTSNPNDRHSGQISFPGGKWEQSDRSLEQVALREAEEEVGVSPENVRLLGRLTELYIPVSNFLVHPFVGFLEGEPQFRPQPGEVRKIMTPPISVFQNPASRKTTDLTVHQGLTIRDVPYFDVDGKVVWGATAMILNEFLEVLAFDKS